MFEMKDEYLVGIELIDEEHKKLFEIIESAYQLLKDEYIVDKYDHIVQILEELKDYTKKHFTDEEEYMESIQYKRLFTQKIQHNSFIEKLENFDLERADEDQEAAIMELLNFLNDWLVNHILNTDKLIGQN